MTRNTAPEARASALRDDLSRFHVWLGAVERGLRGLAGEAGGAAAAGWPAAQERGR